MKLKSWVIAVLCAASSVAGLAEVAQPLAKLANGETITEKDLSAYLDRRIDMRQIALNAWGVEQAVQEMATTRVLDLEGERLGIKREKREESPPRFDDVYSMAVFEKLAPACAQPANEQEARQYFDAHPKAFVMPVQSRVQRVILPIATQVDGKSAQDWLLAQAQAIAAGSQKFGEVVKRADGLYTGDSQGELGWITLDGDNQIMQALKGVTPGNLMGPVRDGKFVYLFLVSDRRPERQLTWEDAKSFVARRAVTYCRSEAVEQNRAKLFKQYGVEIDRAAIRELFARNGRTAKDSSQAQTATEKASSPKK